MSVSKAATTIDVPLTPIPIPLACKGLGDVYNTSASNAYIKTVCYLPGPNTTQGLTYADASASCLSLGMRLYRVDSSYANITLQNLENSKFGANSPQNYISGTDGSNCNVSMTISSKMNVALTDCTTYRGYFCELFKISKLN